MKHSSEREGKHHNLGERLKEVLKPELIEAGSVEDFARLIAQNPNPPDPWKEAILQQQGMHIYPNRPFIQVTSHPTTMLGEEIEFTYEHAGGKPKKIIYKERNPNPPKVQERLAMMRRQNLARDILSKQVEEAGRDLQKASNKPGLEGLFTLLGEMGESLRRGEMRGGSLWDLTAFLPASPEGLAYRELLDRYRQTFEADRAEELMQAYTTAHRRGVEIVVALYDQFESGQANIFVDHNFGSDELFAKVQVERGNKPAWEKPEPKKTKYIRRDHPSRS